MCKIFRYAQVDIEVSTDCLFDYVEIFDGKEMKNTSSFGRICGNINPLNQILSSGRYLIVKFASDRSVNKGGFKLIATATLG